MFERLREMLVKEWIQVFRDPRLRAIVFIFPCMEVILIGYAVTTDVKHVPTAVFDRDETPASRDLISRFFATEYFARTEDINSDERARELLDHGNATLIIRINHGFAEELKAGRTAFVQLLVDGSDSNTAGILMGYASQITAKFSEQALLDRFERRMGSFQRPGAVTMEVRAWFNANLESRNFFVPGVIAIIVTLITLMLTSMSIVREKEIGTIEQIMVTPILPIEFILGKTIPFAIIAFIDVLLVTAVGVFWFEVPVQGSMALLFGATGIYLLTTLGVGLIISTISHTQQQAMMSVFFFMFPAMLLSGFVFPIENMPEAVQWLTYLNPLRYYLVVIRAIFLKGVGMGVLWPQLAPLALMGIATFSIAVRRFHKTL